MVTSTKQKLNMHSSTISEVLDDMIPQILWTWLFMQEQGIKVTDNILYQDNKSAILLEKNGRASSSKRTKLSKFDITTLRIILQREICRLCGVLPAR